MKTIPQKGAEDSKELTFALTHSCWLNSFNFYTVLGTLLHFYTFARTAIQLSLLLLSFLS